MFNSTIVKRFIAMRTILGTPGNLKHVINFKLIIYNFVTFDKGVKLLEQIDNELNYKDFILF